MAKKILLAVDESKSSRKVFRYVIENMQPTAEITLLSILPDATAACGLDSPSLTPLFNANKRAFCSIEDTKKAIVKKFLKEAKDNLVKAGFPSRKLKTLLRKKRKGIARDILKEAETGGYDTIVVGRKGHTRVKDFFMGSVSNKIIHLASDKAVIVVD
jgi:nucleotide-binding universal stress UspA family protein